MWNKYNMSISGIGAYSHLENIIALQNISNISAVADAVQADTAIEDIVEISVAALKMSEQAEKSIALQLIAGLTQ